MRSARHAKPEYRCVVVISKQHARSGKRPWFTDQIDRDGDDTALASLDSKWQILREHTRTIGGTTNDAYGSFGPIAQRYRDLLRFAELSFPDVNKPWQDANVIATQISETGVRRSESQS